MPVNVRLKLTNHGLAEDQFEGIPADDLGGGLVRVRHSPAFVDDLAAGDQIRAASDGTFETVRRGGNLCVQLYRGKYHYPQVEDDLSRAIEDLGGWVDSVFSGVLVYTVPAVPCHPFVPLGRALDAAVARLAEGACWMYGNHWDPADQSRTLDWWLDPDVVAEAPWTWPERPGRPPPGAPAPPSPPATLDEASP